MGIAQIQWVLILWRAGLPMGTAQIQWVLILWRAGLPMGTAQIQRVLILWRADICKLHMAPFRHAILVLVP